MNVNLYFCEQKEQTKPSPETRENWENLASAWLLLCSSLGGSGRLGRGCGICKHTQTRLAIHGTKLDQNKTSSLSLLLRSKLLPIKKEELLKLGAVVEKLPA